MHDELELYAVRMRSMCDSAIDEGSFERLCDDLIDYGYQIDCAEPLSITDHELPLAWSLLATRAS